MHLVALRDGRRGSVGRGHFERRLGGRGRELGGGSEGEGPEEGVEAGVERPQIDGGEGNL